MFYDLIKNLLFRFEPETAHAVALNTLKFAHRLGFTQFFSKPYQPVSTMGLHFPNPIGLAAGLDKNGDYIDALGALGFGFIEIGTVTPKPQRGNPKPRLFRIPDKKALINRMGFNNKGIDYVTQRLKEKKFNGIVGINIGKNRGTPNEAATEDYLICFRKAAPYANYVTINISSPNTENLRGLQHPDLLTPLLKKIKHEQKKLNNYVPLAVKVSPDLTEPEIAQMSEIFLEQKIDAVIAANTTIQHHEKETGGLSGQPLRGRSTEIIKHFHRYLTDQIPLIGCGGIFSAEDIKEKREAGARLVQIYTGFIYQGIKIPNRCIDK